MQELSEHRSSESELSKSPFRKIARTTEFWSRASGIYLAYKGAQLRALALKARGWDDDRINKQMWDPHHEWSGKHMYQLCVDLRGFYLKVGQFFGARADFIPPQVCRQLSRLHDQVPPMPAPQARQVIERELGVSPLEEVFEWVDLDKPLGSASISQVHKGKLRQRSREEREAGALSPVAAAAAAAVEGPAGPEHGLVAVKVQYPDALRTMLLDLGSIRLAAAYLSKTEVQFDLVSPVDELAKQIRLEFDFEREARVMDAIADNLKIPRSVPGLVTKRVMAMNFLEGKSIMRLSEATSKLSASQRRQAAKRILLRVSEAYGRMMLETGLFQADGHPGNILVMKGGKIGLLDYGQSKQLPPHLRRPFARLVLAMDGEDDMEISAALEAVGVETTGTDPHLRSKTAYGMFDTRGRVNPFDPDSTLKKMGISRFPADLFFVLRVVQLLRGLGTGMHVDDFSSAHQWAPFARAALGLPKHCGRRQWESGWSYFAV